MRRAILVALGIGTIISSAAAIGIGTTMSVEPHAMSRGLYEVARTHQAARSAQRSAIEARYQAERTKCDALGGAKRDACLISAHARRGRALLEAGAPYGTPPS